MPPGFLELADGELLFTEGPDTPFAGTVREVLEEFIIASACDLAGAAESGLRALGLDSTAAVYAQSRARAGCAMPPNNELPITQECTTDFNQTGAVCFEGGQCPNVNYQILIQTILH